MYQTDAYSATVHPSDEKSTLQKEVEDNEDIDCLMKTLLKQAILTCLKMAVGDCAKHECHGCKMNHPSQKYHDICLWTSPREWIEDCKRALYISENEDTFIKMLYRKLDTPYPYDYALKHKILLKTISYK